MKKSYLKIAVAVCATAVLMSGCGSSKPVAQQGGRAPLTEEDAEIARLERETKLEEAKAKYDAAKRNREAEERRAQQLAAQEEVFEDGAQMVLVPCQDEGMDKIGEYMGGLGTGEHLVDEQEARAEATTAAIANLAQKFMGVVENIIEDYGNKTNTPDANQARQGDLARGVRIVTRKVLDKYSSTVCQKQLKTKRGAYKVYVATRIPIDTYKQEVSRELDILKVKYDKKKLFESMDEQLARQAAVENQRREQVGQE